MQKRVSLFLLFLLPAIGSFATSDIDNRWVKKVAGFYGERAGMRVAAWRDVVSKSGSLSEEKKLVAVNDFFNQLYFVDDIDLWGKKDYWATPLEFLGSAAGDCEDFSIAKYFTLRELGIDDKKLRLVYVKAIKLNQFHMVVAYYPTPSSEPVLLDNIDPKILKASKRRDLLPVYSFNGSRLWLMKERGKGELAGKSSRLGLWNDLRQRMGSVKLNRPIKNYDG
ncbi:transglutaminase-like cysteine peptidase [Enterovibrio nigricans]|uniref:Predicted transglutaminase-like cysteine proteinase n=1 Tax=Enterovibrio nigricans DSM 22720 TaxID=1121868 RepID=A0A1T4VHN4_9GAMM|nr:transglutaminase-like cysteine peptidase [Enterovibrio nigricans]PKF48817.1 sulfate adenylyltransferase [Enterovibrio nigricans]SKA64403.1 Predicted transglutaminase-like cysteine proteinase [Enterovibrio nigricans DSM 22720]